MAKQLQLRAGLSQIRMVGEKSQTVILQGKDKVGGKFKSLGHFLEHIERRNVNVRVVRMLVLSGSMDSILGDEHKLWKLYFDELYPCLGSNLKMEAKKKELNKTHNISQEYEDQKDNILLGQQEALNFKLNNDIYGPYRKMCTLLAKHLNVHRILDIRDATKDEVPRIYIAQATSIKFGYRDRVAKVGGNASVGTADALGGVYGNIDDGSSFIMAVYGPDVYQKYKETIENIRGMAAVFKATHPWARKSTIMVKDFHSLESISQGDPGFLKLGLVRPAQNSPELKDEYRAAVHGCQMCPLYKTCNRPVPASMGSLNIMVVGEAPGQEEDQKNEGFVGRSGRILFEELEKLGIQRSDCLVTNIVKCRPPNNRLPNIGYALRCPWIGEEIRAYQPRFILALGGTAFYYFKRLKKGIREWNGKTEWNNRAEAWVTYGIHPASVLYERENMVLLRKALQNFSKVLARFAQEEL